MTADQAHSGWSLPQASVLCGVVTATPTTVLPWFDSDALETLHIECFLLPLDVSQRRFLLPYCNSKAAWLFSHTFHWHEALVDLSEYGRQEEAAG